ncbi:MAG: NUDIX domain-containing protein [Chloroflexi bacterium]|nr:NUDIX domain-containing protein [Chloroflexota bacterium]
MANIPVAWKRAAARIVRIPLLNYLMAWGVRLVVPRRRVGVALAAFDERDRILLLRHVFHPSAPWGLPGGWLNRYEAPDAGVLRELKEETGLTAVLKSPILIENQTHPPHIGIIYLGRIQPGDLKLSAEIIEAAWFQTDNLPGPLLPFTKHAIEVASQLVSQEAEMPTG